MRSKYIRWASILPQDLRTGIVEQLRRIHFQECQHVKKHIAYLVPEATAFAMADVEDILGRLDYATDRVYEDVVELANQGLLKTERQRVPSDNRYQNVFVMERRTRNAYADQLEEQQHDREPEKRMVSAELEDLRIKITDEQKKTFLDETIKCLQVDANRAAIVMAWNLAYYQVREWVLMRRLPIFNKELTKRTRLTRPNQRPTTYPIVRSRDDFPDIEWLVLDVCRAAGILDSHRFGILDAALKKRNRYAHPSPAKASGPEATGYVAELLKNVLLESYFS